MPVKATPEANFAIIPFMRMLSTGDILSLNKAGTCYLG